MKIITGRLTCGRQQDTGLHCEQQDTINSRITGSTAGREAGILDITARQRRTTSSTHLKDSFHHKEWTSTLPARAGFHLNIGWGRFINVPFTWRKMRRNFAGTGLSVSSSRKFEFFEFKISNSCWIICGCNGSARSAADNRAEHLRKRVRRCALTSLSSFVFNTPSIQRLLQS